MEISDCIARLTSKDSADACAWANQIAEESRENSRWAPYLTEFAALLRHKNSLVRNRAISILAANARWMEADQLDALMDEFLRHITDEKPITARQCIQALPEIAAARSRLIPRIRHFLVTRSKWLRHPSGFGVRRSDRLSGQHAAADSEGHRGRAGTAVVKRQPHLLQDASIEKLTVTAFAAERTSSRL